MLKHICSCTRLVALSVYDPCLLRCVSQEVGKDMETRVVKWFDYIWATKQDLDEDSVLTLLPSKLKMEIARFVHFDVLKQVRLFHDVEDQFLEELVLKLKFEVSERNMPQI